MTHYYCSGNIRGLLQHHTELHQLVALHSLWITVIEETYLKQKASYKFKNYIIFRYDDTKHLIAKEMYVYWYIIH